MCIHLDEVGLCGVLCDVRAHCDLSELVLSTSWTRTSVAGAPHQLQRRALVISSWRVVIHWRR